MDPISRHHVCLDQRDQRREQRGTGADPVRQCRDIEIDPLPGVDFAPSVQWLMMSELRLKVDLLRKSGGSCVQFIAIIS